MDTNEFACEEVKRCWSSHPYGAQVLSIPRKLSKTEDKTLRRGKDRSFLQRNIYSWAVLCIDEARGNHKLMEKLLCFRCMSSNCKTKFWGIHSSSFLSGAASIEKYQQESCTFEESLILTLPLLLYHCVATRVVSSYVWDYKVTVVNRNQRCWCIGGHYNLELLKKHHSRNIL